MKYDEGPYEVDSGIVQIAAALNQHKSKPINDGRVSTLLPGK